MLNNFRKTSTLKQFCHLQKYYTQVNEYNFVVMHIYFFYMYLYNLQFKNTKKFLLSIFQPLLASHYPSELEIQDTTDTRRTASYLDLFLNIDTDRRLHTKIYDKRDNFNFPIINFPFLISNIPSAPSYGIYISQLIRYCRACSHYADVVYMSVLLTQKLFQQSYEEDRLKEPPRKFYGHHYELVDPYFVSLFKLIKDIFTTF